MPEDVVRQLLEGIHADVTGLREEVRRQGDALQAMREERIADRARAEALAATDARIRELPEVVSDLSRRVDSIGARIEDGTAGGRPRIWESDDGRRVLWWLAAAAVLCCLAIGGGLTFADLRPLVIDSPAASAD